jgi:hypothetical protein
MGTIGIKPILDKELPDIKVAVLDVSTVEALKPAELVVVKEKWVTPSRTNEQLVILIEQCPAKIERINAMLATQTVPDQSLVDKVVRLKEQYAVCLKEISARRTVAIAKEPVMDVE